MIPSAIHIARRSPVLYTSIKPHGQCLFRNKMATYATAAQGTKPTFDSIGIKNRNISVADGQSLSDEQKVIVGSVLDVGP